MSGAQSADQTVSLIKCLAFLRSILLHDVKQRSNSFLTKSKFSHTLWCAVDLDVLGRICAHISICCTVPMCMKNVKNSVKSYSTEQQNKKRHFAMISSVVVLFALSLCLSLKIISHVKAKCPLNQKLKSIGNLTCNEIKVFKINWSIGLPTVWMSFARFKLYKLNSKRQQPIDEFENSWFTCEATGSKMLSIVFVWKTGIFACGRWARFVNFGLCRKLLFYSLFLRLFVCGIFVVVVVVVSNATLTHLM